MMRKHRRRLVALIVVTLVALVVCPFLGIKWLTPGLIAGDSSLAHIFFGIRIPRTLAGFIAGGGLAVAGMVCQALFRNPLASPYTLGISGGASLGAALCIAMGAGVSAMGVSIVSFGAFAGAVGSILLVYAFAWSRESNSITLLLAGVIVSTVCSGLIWFVHYLSPIRHSYQITRWIMGGVDSVNTTMLVALTVSVALYALVIALMLPMLDQFLTGDYLAHARGVNVRQSRMLFIVATAIAVGAIVSICGPIGFVGIMAPHACRMLFPGVRHRMLAACSFLTGGAFLIVCDTLARTIAPPSEIPVGIITALLGGPFFLSILFKKKGRLQL